MFKYLQTKFYFRSIKVCVGGMWCTKIPLNLLFVREREREPKNVMRKKEKKRKIKLMKKFSSSILQVRLGFRLTTSTTSWRERVKRREKARMQSNSTYPENFLINYP
jgi:hypothetical protein